jgi:hypothetical protein
MCTAEIAKAASNINIYKNIIIIEKEREKKTVTIIKLKTNK